MNLKDELFRLMHKLIGEAGYDKTHKGVVTDVLVEGKCRVKWNGTESTVPSLIPELQRGDRVWLLLPQNQVSDAMIIGKR